MISTTMLKTVLRVFIMTMFPVALHAQLSLGNQRERFSLSATVSGSTNSDYTWDEKHRDNIADGRMYRTMNVRLRSNINMWSNRIFGVSVSPFYNYNTTHLQTNWRGTPMFDFPKEHHHYGATLTASMNMLLGKKPMTLMATTAPNLSENGFENMSGVIASIVHVTRSQTTYLALGAFYLYLTPFSWPLYPLFIYRHKFDDRWSVSLMEANDFIYYQATPKLKYALGAELVSDIMYFRPDNPNLPKKAIYSLLSERVGLYATLQISDEISMELSGGVNIPFRGRVMESGRRDVYMRLHDKAKPYIQLKMNYSVMKKQ